MRDNVNETVEENHAIHILLALLYYFVLSRVVYLPQFSVHVSLEFYQQDNVDKKIQNQK